MTWSPKELEALATQYYKHLTPRCPVCKAPVEGELHQFMGQKTGMLALYCDRCGARGTFTEPHLEEMDLQWTQTELQRIEEEYFERGYATCPNDGSIFRPTKTHLLGQRVPHIDGFCPRCGRRFANSLIQRSVKVSPFEEKYENLKKIADGGMGSVFLVRERATGRQLAAKTIKAEHVRDPNIVRRFRREERLLRSLTHPHVVPLVDAFLDESGGVLVMEYMRDGDLVKAINDTTVPHEKLVSIFEDVVDGVQFLHRSRIVHRDLKPANVLIDATGGGRVSDFGLAVLEIRDTTPLTGQAAFLGTFHYAAPEQLRDAANADYRADIYALGLIAYEIAMRESPYQPPLSSTGDAELDTAVRAAIDRDPNRRSADVTRLTGALRQHVAGKSK